METDGAPIVLDNGSGGVALTVEQVDSGQEVVVQGESGYTSGFKGVAFSIPDQDMFSVLNVPAVCLEPINVNYAFTSGGDFSPQLWVGRSLVAVSSRQIPSGDSFDLVLQSLPAYTDGGANVPYSHVYTPRRDRTSPSAWAHGRRPAQW